MIKVLMKESSYDNLKKAILGSRLDNKLVNEISYGTVDRAFDRTDELFGDVRSYFEDYYSALSDAILKSKDKEGNGNIYLDKIKEYSDLIYNILSKKRKQQDNFHNNTMKKFDYKKFYADNEKPEEWENNYDDLDLRMLQNKYPK